MSEWIHDLFAHQAWADAEHWRALEAHATALDDPAIRRRLHHIHLVQRAFLSIVRNEPIAKPELEDFRSLRDLKRWAIEGHAIAAQVLTGLTPEAAGRRAEVPWFREPPLDITNAQALVQAAMHSHYHRGQNAARLRELGGEPPLTDMIVWWWKGRPAPQWD
jgi:uncharacterized damage-inducible protein DinB